MSANPNKFSRFWKELKRRNVLRSLAIYAGTAFIILEATTIIFPRWGFPEWAIDLVLWLLILGAFINIIIAWIYDITPGGVQRTKPLEEVSGDGKIQDSRKWKAATYISLVVIVALIVYNIIPIKNVKAGEIQSLVILPFDNYTGDDQFDNMVAGMHSLLCGDMGRISGLRVVSKTSSKMYGGVEMSATDIASELNVDAIVEASIMCFGDTVCMQFRLVSTTGDEKQLWVADYKEDKSQILNLYNRVTKQIAEEVRIELTENEEQILAKNRTVDREAFDSFLQSYSYLEDLSEEGLTRALEFLAETIEKDPEWAPPYAAVAMVWAGLSQMSFAPRDYARPIIWENINKALELDPDLTELNFAIGIAEVWTEWNWGKAEKAFLKALAINPNDVMSRMYYAHLLMILQRPGEAFTQGQLATDLDPLNPLIQALFAPVLSDAVGWEAAYSQVEKTIAMDPDNYFAYNMLDLFAIKVKKYDRAIEGLLFFLPFENEVKEDITALYEQEGLYPTLEEVMRQLEEIAYLGPVDMAMRYGLANQNEKALEYLETGFEIHDPNMPYITTSIGCFNALYSHPKFIAIVEKMNLPQPKE